MTMTSQPDKDPMTDTALPPAHTLLDNVSDYGDFGSDAEEIEILDNLLAQIDSKRGGDQAHLLLIDDIEDYEQPRGILLPKNNTHQHSPRVEIEPDSQTLRDHIQVELCTSNTGASYCDADPLTSD